MSEPIIPTPVALPPFKAWLASNIPAVYDNTMSYYDELTSLIAWLENEVVPNVNSAIELVNMLKDYVENYFKNLDVQEEINNKLDQMAEDGTLQEIITAYIQANVAWTFDSVADMKLAVNFVNGSYAQTLGYYAKNDGGASLYKIRTITNDDVVDEAKIIELADDTLIAELIIPSPLNVKQLGVKGDGTTDDTTKLQIAMSSGYPVYMPEGTYMTGSLTLTNVVLTGVKATLKCNTEVVNFLSATDSSIDGVDIDCNSKADTAILITGLHITLKNSKVSNSLSWAIKNTTRNSDDKAYFEKLVLDNCYAGLQLYGYPQDDPDDYQSRIDFINCSSVNNTGYGTTGDSAGHIYFFAQLDYVYILGGNFTGNADKAVVNVYQVNHAIIDGGYYHDIRHGVTLGKITKNAIVANTINENIKYDSGISVDLVTADRVYPEGHCLITNNIVKNAYRGVFIQGKNVILNNNYFYGGTYTTVTTGYIRCNAEDNNTADSHIIIDNIYMYNFPSLGQFISTGTAVATIGENIYVDGTPTYASITATNQVILQGKTVEASDTLYVEPFTDTIIANATTKSFNIFLPNAVDNCILGKTYKLIRKDSNTGVYSVTLRVRSDNGSIDGTSGLNKSIAANSALLITQIAPGVYYTI